MDDANTRRLNLPLRFNQLGLYMPGFLIDGFRCSAMPSDYRGVPHFVHKSGVSVIRFAANRKVVIELIHEARAAGAAVVGIFHDEEVRDAVASRCVPIQ